MDDDNAVARHADVELERAHAELERARERGQRVLRQVAARAAVALDVHGYSGSEDSRAAIVRAGASGQVSRIDANALRAGKVAVEAAGRKLGKASSDVLGHGFGRKEVVQPDEF